MLPIARLPALIRATRCNRSRRWRHRHLRQASRMTHAQPMPAAPATSGRRWLRHPGIVRSRRHRLVPISTPQVSSPANSRRAHRRRRPRLCNRRPAPVLTRNRQRHSCRVRNQRPVRLSPCCPSRRRRGRGPPMRDRHPRANRWDKRHPSSGRRHHMERRHRRSKPCGCPIRLWHGRHPWHRGLPAQRRHARRRRPILTISTISRISGAHHGAFRSRRPLPSLSCVCSEAVPSPCT